MHRQTPIELEDDVGAFQIQAIEKSGALANWVVCTVVGNTIDHKEMSPGSAGRCFDMARHYTSVNARVRPLYQAPRTYLKTDSRTAAEDMASNMRCVCRKRRNQDMLSQTVDTTTQKPKMFMDIPTAANLAGFSLRHFRRIIEEDAIPIVQIGRKFFILGRDFSAWESNKRSRKN
jgi:hypothetical protein